MAAEWKIILHNLLWLPLTEHPIYFLQAGIVFLIFAVHEEETPQIFIPEIHQ